MAEAVVANPNPNLSETDILAEGSEEETSVEGKASEETEVDDEAPPEAKVEEEETEETEEEVEEDPLKVEDENLPGAPPFNKLRKDPEIGKFLKQYPQLQANYFKAEKYAEYFPTVEEAEEAAKKVEIFDVIDSQISQGDFKSLVEHLSGFNPQGLTKVADEIVPMLHAKDPQLYVRVAKPIITQALKYALNLAAGHSDKAAGENIKNAAAVIAHVIFGDASQLNAPATQVPQPDPEKDRLAQANAQLISQQLGNFQSEAHSEGASALRKEIEAGLDPEGKLTPFVKERLVETIFMDVNERLANDQNTRKQMQSLWANAYKAGLTREAKLSLKRAYLGRAKMILPQIRSRRFSEALGTRKPNGPGKTIVPATSGAPHVKTTKVTTEQVRKEGMSEMDIILHGARK